MSETEPVDKQLSKDKNKYKCDKCEFTTDYKHSYQNHVSRKTKCGNDALICNTCKKSFKKKNTLYQHKKKCDKKTIINTDNSGTISGQNEMNIKFHLEKDASASKVNVIGTDASITNNYYILPFGQENMKFITVEDVKQLLDAKFEYMKKYIRLVHLNPEHGENYNIHVTDDLLDKVKLWNGDVWNFITPEEFNFKMFENVQKVMETVKTQYDLKIPKEIELYNKLLDEYKRSLTGGTLPAMDKDNKDMIVYQLKTIIMDLYNYRNRVTAEHEKIKMTIDLLTKTLPKTGEPPATAVHNDNSDSSSSSSSVDVSPYCQPPRPVERHRSEDALNKADSYYNSESSS